MENLETREIAKDEHQLLLVNNVLYFAQTISVNRKPKMESGKAVPQFGQFDISTRFTNLLAKNVIASVSLAHVNDNAGSSARWGVSVQKIEVVNRTSIRVTCTFVVDGSNVDLVEICLSGVARGDI